jgi:hypothetical protein
MLMLVPVQYELLHTGTHVINSRHVLGLLLLAHHGFVPQDTRGLAIVVVSIRTGTVHQAACGSAEK